MDSVLLGIDAPVQNRPRFLQSQEPTKPNLDCHFFSLEVLAMQEQVIIRIYHLEE